MCYKSSVINPLVLLNPLIMTQSVSTVDNQVFIIPDDYFTNSNYFKILNQYQSSGDLSTNDNPATEFYLEDLELINLSVTNLDHNQVLSVHPIDRFFQHQQRLSDVEAKIVTHWMNRLYEFNNKKILLLKNGHSYILSEFGDTIKDSWIRI